jgi:hypothetical protein
MPVLVSAAVSAAAPSVAVSFAMPKSRIYTSGSAASPTRKMFSGLRSRCRTPRVCA